MATGPTLILALYIEPSWLAQMKRSLSLSARPDFFQRPCVELTPHMRSVSEALVADMMSPAFVRRDRVEDLLFDLLIGLFERFSGRLPARVQCHCPGWALFMRSWKDDWCSSAFGTTCLAMS